MKTRNKKIIFGLVFLVLVVFFNSANAWIEPTTLPPGNNILAPLNSSAFGQSKVGGLILNLGNAAHGLIVRYGLVGIGTDNPQAILDVSSTNSGVLFPRMTTAQRNAISNPPEGLLIFNTETKQLEIYAAGAWKASGGSSSGGGVPIGAIAFFNLDSCPTGWEKIHEAKGRYIVGTPDGGTKGGTQGTALSNLENRPVGQHTHTLTDPGHIHQYKQLYGSSCWTGGGMGWYGCSPGVASGNILTSYTGISIQGSGTVSGTNAPYIQYLVCQKVSNDGETTTTTTTTTTTGGESFWKKFESNIYYNESNVGIGTHTPSTKLQVVGKTSFTRDGVNECCGNDATITLGENTASTGKKASISFHNAGRHEGTFELAPDGERRFRMYDNQGARMGLETTGNVRVGSNLCLSGDCRLSWSVPRRNCFWISATKIGTNDAFTLQCPDGYHSDGYSEGTTQVSGACGLETRYLSSVLCCND